jgi:hypothetical protein
MKIIFQNKISNEKVELPKVEYKLSKKEMFFFLETALKILVNNPIYFLIYISNTN